MIIKLADFRGVLLRREVIAAGGHDKALNRALRAGLIVRIRQGAYVLKHVWDTASPVERHRLLSHAVMRQYAESLVARSHASAVLELGGPSWGLDLSAAHVTHMNGQGERTLARVRHHHGYLGAADVTRVSGFWQTTPARSVLDTAATSSRDASVVLFDWVMSSGLCSREQLDDQVRQMMHWPNSLSFVYYLRLANGLSESVGETRTHLLCRDHGLPLPVPQMPITDRSGRLLGRVDFAWPEYGVILEFDGMGKYINHLRPGESTADAVIREKLREDAIREATGWRFIRITWADLQRPGATAARIAAALRLAA